LGGALPFVFTEKLKTPGCEDGIGSSSQTKIKHSDGLSGQTDKLICPKYIAELLELRWLYCG